MTARENSNALVNQAQRGVDRVTGTRRCHAGSHHVSLDRIASYTPRVICKTCADRIASRGGKRARP